MRRFICFASLCLTLLLSVSIVRADVVDSLDFSTDGHGTRHKTGVGGIPIGSSPVAGGIAPDDWELTFDPLFIFTDDTLNVFQTSGGVMQIRDWGGDGTVTSTAWIATDDGSMDIAGASIAVGNDIFRDSGEGITWFYSINGSTVSTFLGETELGGTPVDNGTDLGLTFSNIAVSNGDSIVIGFKVNIEGENDGLDVSSMSIDFTAVPEPTSLFVLGFGFVGLACRRKRR